MQNGFGINTTFDKPAVSNEIINRINVLLNKEKLSLSEVKEVEDLLFLIYEHISSSLNQNRQVFSKIGCIRGYYCDSFDQGQIYYKKRNPMQLSVHI